jgi:drug/metabolite transporter (DMT)-like permease
MTKVLGKTNILIGPLVALIWGGSFVAVKIGLEETSPFVLAFLRFAVASPLMFMVAAWKKKPLRISRGDFPGLLVLALTGVTLLYILQYLGIHYSTAMNSAILINTNVIFIAVLSTLVFNEVFSRKKTMGVTLGFVGAVFVVASTSLFSLSLSFEGDILVILSAFCWAIYTIVGKYFLKKYDPLTITAYVFLVGTLLFIPLILQDFHEMVLSLQGWGIVLYLAVPCSVFAYVAWYDALSRMEATKIAIFLNLIPVFAVIFSFLILQEDITYGMIAGALCIMYGIYLTQRG